MKKYAFALFAFTLLFTLLSFSSSVSADNCAPGDRFNSTTGASCSTTAYVCTTAFDPNTGLPCSGTSISSASSSSVVTQFNTLYKTSFYIGFKGSNDVKALQQFLKDHGYYAGIIDGSYGSMTDRAVKDFQFDYNLNTISANTNTGSSTSTLTITTPSTLPNAKVGQPYSTNIQATGGSGSYGWGIQNGSVAPSGLQLVCSLSGPTCSVPITFSGTPTTAGTYTFTVQANDFSKNLVTNKQFNLTVDPATTTSNQQPVPTISPVSVNLDLYRSTPAQTFTVGPSGATNLTKATYVFSGGTYKITELKFDVYTNNGYDVYTLNNGTNTPVTSITVNGISTSVFINGVADVTGLNIAVPNNTIDGSSSIDVSVSYPGVGVNGIASGSKSRISLEYVKYTSNGVTNTYCTTDFGLCTNTMNSGIYTPVMTLVSSPATVASNSLTTSTNYSSSMVVSSVNPSSGSGGETVTVNGSGFTPDSIINFGQSGNTIGQLSGANIISSSATQIVFKLDTRLAANSTPGVYQLWVSNSTMSSNRMYFTINPVTVAHPWGRIIIQDSCTDPCNINITGSSSGLLNAGSGGPIVHLVGGNRFANGVSYPGNGSFADTDTGLHVGTYTYNLYAYNPDWSTTWLASSKVNVVAPDSTSTSSNSSATAFHSISVTRNGASVSGSSFMLGDSFTISLTSNQPNRLVYLCSDHSTNCITINNSMTDSTGYWSYSGTWSPTDTSSIGKWNEWMQIVDSSGSLIKESNHISFSLSAKTAMMQNQTQINNTANVLDGWMSFLGLK